MNLCYSGSIFKIPNKFWEFQMTMFDDYSSLFDFQFSWTLKGDHAGLNIQFEILKLYICFKVND